MPNIIRDILYTRGAGRMSVYRLTHIMRNNGMCIQCRKESIPVNRCSKCFSVSYCSIDCQKEDWDRHRPICNSHYKTFNVNLPDIKISNEPCVPNQIAADIAASASSEEENQEK